MYPIVRDRNIAVQGQPGQKVHETPLSTIRAGHGSPYLSSQLDDNINRRIVVQVYAGINARFY
jgi:hypothetical protein